MTSVAACSAATAGPVTYGAGRDVGSLGSFDGFETVPLYVHAGGDGGPQSADAHGFVNIITDAMVPQVGQDVYGRWAIPTHGFAAGWYRGVVAVREQ